MLSFMREQMPGDPSGHEAAAGGPAGLRPQDQGDSQEYLTVAASRTNLRKNTILVAILFTVGLVGLGLMIHKTRPQAASAQPGGGEQAKIEAAINRITGGSLEMSDGIDAVVQKFHEFSDVVQVKVNELTKNPFEIEGYMKELQKEAVVDEDPQLRAQLLARQQIQKQAATLRLLSVMRSEGGNSCMINDEILQQGDTIADFTVTRIGANSVELMWLPSGGTSGVSGMQDHIITLKLSD